MTTTAPLATTADTNAITRWEALANDIAVATEIDGNQPPLDYSNPEDQQYARSLIRQHRKLNARIEKARVEAKAFYLEGGRAVDATAKELAKSVEALIERHAAPIKAIEDAEAARVRTHQQTLQRIDALGRGYNVPASDVLGTQRPAATAAEARDCLALLGQIDPLTCEEFSDSARAAIANASAELETMIGDLEQREAEAAELQALRAAAAAREQADREEAIRREAAEAEREAAADREAIAAADRIAAEQRAAEAAQRLEAMQRQEAARQAAEAMQLEAAQRKQAQEAQARQELLEEFTNQILHKIEALDHRQIAAAIATDTLDDAVRVNWSLVFPF